MDCDDVKSFIHASNDVLFLLFFLLLLEFPLLHSSFLLVMKIPPPKDAHEDSFAIAVLRGLGWKPGTGLGRKEDGIRTNLKVEKKADLGGIGHKEFDPLLSSTILKNFENALKSFPSAEEDGALDEGLVKTKKIKRKKPKRSEKQMPKAPPAQRSCVLSGFVQSTKSTSTLSLDLENKDDDEEGCFGTSDKKVFEACGRATLKRYVPLGKLSRIQSADELHKRESKLGTDSEEEPAQEEKSRKIRKVS
jgi:hypothetical protein